ncbi:MFS transporter [Burkholderia sp. WSM2230]|uniref:MFS transporter n=1 Tax=Burkholderia sp. WSM2230 TaxID=944435 RepID=UPI0003F8709C|nr:MFS transporter [Burkholderia sp. WSM2230]
MVAAQGGRSPFQDQTTLSGNQKTLIALVGIGSMLEFWDAYLIGFIMAFLIKPWGLTYGIMGAVLLASGGGAIVGGAVWGMLADRFGRKPVFVASLLVLGAASIALAFTPERGWVYMAAMRVLIGFCSAGYFIQIALVQEFTPPKRRGMLTGVVSAITTGGLLLGALSGAWLIPTIGWRWTFVLGAAPAAIALVGALRVPESPRWLSLHGRQDDARKAVAWARGDTSWERDHSAPQPAAARSWFDIFQCPRNVLTTGLINVGLISGYYGIVLWGPTLMSQVQSVSPVTASKVMIGFSLIGIMSRLVAALLADRIGRRKTGGFYALAAAVALVLAGYIGHGDLFSPSLFWLPLLLSFVFADGSLSVCAAYSTEVWPSRLRGSGAGFAGLAGSVGKILGPLGLAMTAGSANIVMPSATVSVIVPAFQFLAACLAVCGLTYLVFGIEARGKPLESFDQPDDGAAPALDPAHQRQNG